MLRRNSTHTPFVAFATPASGGCRHNIGTAGRHHQLPNVALIIDERANVSLRTRQRRKKKKKPSGIGDSFSSRAIRGALSGTQPCANAYRSPNKSDSPHNQKQKLSDSSTLPLEAPCTSDHRSVEASGFQTLLGENDEDAATTSRTNH